MNHFLPPDEPTDAGLREEAIADAQLDRLVDGELNDDERRALLERLDRTADGWRRLALAFLEAQACREEIAFPAPPGSIPASGVTRRVAETNVRPAQQPEPKPRPSSAAPAPGWVAVAWVAAASFMLALGVGWGWRVWWSAPMRPPTVDSAAPDAGSVAQPRQATLRPPVRALTDGAAKPGLTNTAGRPVSVGDVKLLMADGREIEVPVYDWMHGGAQWLSEDPLVPEDLVRALQHAGLQVRSTQEWIPVQVEGSDPMVVPVEQLDIFPVANAGPYQ